MVIVAAALFALGFEPFNIWIAPVFALLLLVKKMMSSQRPILVSFLFGFISHLAILNWSRVYVGVAPLISLAFLQALYSLPLGFHIKRGWSVAWLPTTFLIAEYLRESFPFGGFGWTLTGYSQINAPYRHLASIGGVYLLSTLVISFSVMRNRYQALLVSGLVFFSLFIVNPTGRGEVKVAAVQGGYFGRTSDYFSDIRRVFMEHYTLTKNIEKVDVVIWPEGVVDGKPESAEFARYFKELKGDHLIVGASPTIFGQPENQSIYIQPDGSVESIYSKNSLVPFGEYVPFRSLVSKLNSHVDEVTDFRPGNSFNPHTIDEMTYGPLICFEIIDSSLVRQAAKRSQILLAQTNSATFHGSSAAKQQFAITRMRAIEYSRSIVSVSTVGVTGIIDSNGEVLEELPEDKADVLYGKVMANEFATPYAAFPFGAIVVVLVFGLFGRRRAQ